MSAGGTEAYRGSLGLPSLVVRAAQAALKHGFAFSCLPSHGRLLQLLAGGIADGRIGETGTGCGVGLAWLACGARPGTRLVSIDHDEQLVAIARAVFADVPAVQVLHGDWHDLQREGPFDLLALDGGGQGKNGEAPIEPRDWLHPAGTVVIDDFTPVAIWAPTYNGTPDRVSSPGFTTPRSSPPRSAPNPTL